jgi:hypothetical protein
MAAQAKNVLHASHFKVTRWLIGDIRSGLSGTMPAASSGIAARDLPTSGEQINGRSAPPIHLAPT